jgi:hypothetical protein
MFKKYQKNSGRLFKKLFFLVLMLFISKSFVYAGSKIIISGRSSIIIESADNKSKLIVSKIETVSGGKLIKKVAQDAASEKLSDLNAGFDNGLPTEFVIEKAYPNPFNPTTRIRYGVSTSTSVNVAIYDMTGRLVSEHKIGEKEQGWHEFTWQGTDSYGQKVSTGIYLVTMRAGEYFQKQKVTFLK